MSDEKMSNMLNNLNITPEMINNMANMLKNGNFGTNNSSEQNISDSNDANIETFNQNIKNSNSSFHDNENSSKKSTNYSENDDKQSSNQNTENTSNSSSSSSANNIDFNTILKIKSIMDTLNKNDDPRSNLLYSLKPYLREPRREKIDQYVNLFKISQVSNLFKNNDKGDKQ